MEEKENREREGERESERKTKGERWRRREMGLRVTGNENAYAVVYFLYLP